MNARRQAHLQQRQSFEPGLRGEVGHQAGQQLREQRHDGGKTPVQVGVQGWLEEREEADGLGFSRMSGSRKAGEANSTHLGRGRASTGAAMPAEATVNGGLSWHGGRK